MGKKKGKKKTKSLATKKLPLRQLEKRADGLWTKNLFNEAEAIYLKILERDTKHLAAYFRLGIIKLNQGLFEKALEFFEKARSLSPFEASIHYYIGLAYEHSGKIDEAIDHQLVCHKLTLNNQLTSTGSHSENKWLSPSSITEKLSFLYYRRNNHKKAMHYVLKTIETEPNNLEANLIHAKLDRNKGQYEKAALRLEGILQHCQSENDIKASILNELGHVHDRLQQYEKAIQYFTESNNIIRLNPLARGIDTRPTHNIIFQTLEYLQNKKSDDKQEISQHVGMDFLAPLFLVGFPRSGTTLTEQLLYKEFGFKVSDEHMVIPYIASALSQILQREFNYPADLDGLTRDEISMLRKEYWKQMEKSIPGVLKHQKNFLDKLPLNIIGLPLIEKIFPDCKIIVALRDPRDVCISNFSQIYSLNASMVHFLTFNDTVKFYNMVMSVWVQIRQTLKVPFFESRYEDLVKNKEVLLASLSQFVKGETDIIHAPKSDNLDRYISTPSHYDATQPIYIRSLERWRNYQNILNDHFDALQPIIKELGYSRS